MDPCPFVRVTVESLALKLQNKSAKPLSSSSGIHPSATPCFCRITLNALPPQTALLPLTAEAPPHNSSAAVFHLDLRRLSVATLRLSVYSGRGRLCGGGGGKLVGRLRLGLRPEDWDRAAVVQRGWLKVGGKGGGEDKARLVHVVVRCEPEPRFAFQFGGKPECSPVVFQIQGSVRQPVFSLNFSADRNSTCRSLPSDYNASGGSNKRHGWMRRWSRRGREKLGRERKGWMVTVHDLSGSPVAAASMTTPFVPSPNSRRVSRSNPGAWLILRPDSSATWKPWGRLEAWRQRGPASSAALGLRFCLAGAAAPIAEAAVSAGKGGRFCIDGGGGDGRFVMESTVGGHVVVHVGVRHVTCTPDAALFVALAAAVDLSVDACRLFSGLSSATWTTSLD